MTSSAPETTREDQTALDADVIVVGGGNAAFTAAHAAAVRGRKVLLLAKAPNGMPRDASYVIAARARPSRAAESRSSRSTCVADRAFSTARKVASGMLSRASRSGVAGGSATVPESAERAELLSNVTPCLDQLFYE